jgi:hypothetical protein
MKAFGPLFRQEAMRYADMPFDSKLRKFWKRYVNGHAKKVVKKMNEGIFKKGGAWDHFSGKDGVM